MMRENIAAARVLACCTFERSPPSNKKHAEQARPRSAQQQAARQDAVDLLKDLCDTMIAGSLCAMGGMTPYPVLSALEHFPEDFRRGEVIATDAMNPV